MSLENGSPHEILSAKDLAVGDEIVCREDYGFVGDYGVEKEYFVGDVFKVTRIVNYEIELQEGNGTVETIHPSDLDKFEKVV